MPKFINCQSANEPNKSIAENPVFYIVIMGTLDSGFAAFDYHERLPTAWLVGKSYLPPVIRQIGAIQFHFYDYHPLKTDREYRRIAWLIMWLEGLDKS